MNKILASDYDQTFYISDEDIEKNKKLVNQFQKLENLFVIATGRSYLDFQNKLNMYHFSYDYVILNHGATILDKENHMLQNISISNDIILDLKRDLSLEKSISYNKDKSNIKQININYIRSEYEKIGLDLGKLQIRYIFLTGIKMIGISIISLLVTITSVYTSTRIAAYFGRDLRKRIVSKVIKYESEEYTKEKEQYISKKYKDYVNVYLVGKNSMEIISKDINKADAIMKVAKINGKNEEDIYTIGDGYSDIEMIKRFDGYAMENAVNEVKKYAIKEYPSVSNLIEDILEEKI